MDVQRSFNHYDQIKPAVSTLLHIDSSRHSPNLCFLQPWGRVLSGHEFHSRSSVPALWERRTSLQSVSQDHWQVRYGEYVQRRPAPDQGLLLPIWQAYLDVLARAACALQGLKYQRELLLIGLVYHTPLQYSTVSPRYREPPCDVGCSLGLVHPTWMEDNLQILSVHVEWDVGRFDRA